MQNTDLNFLPDILREIVELFAEKYPNISKKIILNILLSKIAQMLTCKRIAFDESGQINIPNWYTMIFMRSGEGKDRLVKDFDKIIFKDFNSWFKNEAQTLYEKQQQQYAEDEKIKTKNDSEEKALTIIKGGLNNEKRSAANPF